jgi:hypothetical protein
MCAGVVDARSAARRGDDRGNRRAVNRAEPFTPFESLEEEAIARTVIYAALFDYPLTLDQVHHSLIESNQTPDEIVATYASSRLLHAVVEYRDGFFFPRGRWDLVAERGEREARSVAFLADHRRMLALTCALPYVRMVALSGSIAHLNLERGGDLDLFIVTRGTRVWSVTVAIIVLAKLLRRRRTVCANFAIADSRLSLEQQDLFTANQVIHLKPVIGGDVWREVLAANGFVRRFYPNVRAQQPAGSTERSAGIARAKSIVEWALRGPSWIVEKACRAAYGAYLRRKAGSWQSPEQVQLRSDYLKLHTRSHRQSILERFDQAMAAAVARATMFS